MLVSANHLTRRSLLPETAGLLLLACGLAAPPSLLSADSAPRKARVLLLGDSISVGYTAEVREQLQDIAEVFRPTDTGGAAENCEGTTKGRREIARWLAAEGGHWDVIHFNFGLHDLKHINPKTGQNSTNPRHPRQAAPEIYERQLEEIVRALKGTGAKLILATTTPVPEGPVRPLRVPGDVDQYNAIARRIAQTEGLVVNDLFASARPRLGEWQRPADVHFTPAGNHALAREVARQIRNALWEASMKSRS